MCRSVTSDERGVCGEFGWVRFLVVGFLRKTNPNPRKNYLLWEKVAQAPLLNLIFLGLGWPWVGEFVGFMTIFTCFPTYIIWYTKNRNHPDTFIAVY